MIILYTLALLGLFFLGYHGYGFIQDVKTFMTKAEVAAEALKGVPASLDRIEDALREVSE